MLISHFDSL